MGNTNRIPMTKAELIDIVFTLVEEGHKAEVSTTPLYSGGREDKPSGEVKLTRLGKTTIWVRVMDDVKLYWVTEDNSPIIRELKIYK